MLAMVESGRGKNPLTQLKWHLLLFVGIAVNDIGLQHAVWQDEAKNSKGQGPLDPEILGIYLKKCTQRVAKDIHARI